MSTKNQDIPKADGLDLEPETVKDLEPRTGAAVVGGGSSSKGGGTVAGGTGVAPQTKVSGWSTRGYSGRDTEGIGSISLKRILVLNATVGYGCGCV